MSVDTQSYAERCQQAQADLASISRVSHRLALIDTTEQLGNVLDKLLPRLLTKIGDNHQNQLRLQDDKPNTLSSTLASIHTKLVEMLSHTMKRVRDDPKCPIPCLAILNLLTEPNNKSPEVPQAKSAVDPFTMNLALAFLTLGWKRCSLEQLQALVPSLVVLVAKLTQSVQQATPSAATRSQWQQLSHLLLRCMEGVVQAQEEAIAQGYSNKRHKKTNETLSNSTTKTPIAISEQEEPLVLVRRLVANDETAARAIYDLLLDVFLYQTLPGSSAASSLPPPGLSHEGNQRLRGGASYNGARDWAAEMAPRSRLGQLQGRLLEWIAPSRMFGLFLGNTSNDLVDKESQSTEKDDKFRPTQRGLARTLAFLIVASGDASDDVSQRATMYLKQHLATSASSSSDIQKTYGDSFWLLQQLLILLVGGNNASMVLSNTGPASAAGDNLSFRRRMVSEGNTFCALANYSAKLLEDLPKDIKLVEDATWINLGNLTVTVCQKTLSQLHTTRGLSALRGRPYIAAAQLLNSLVVRFTSIAPSRKEADDDGTTFVIRQISNVLAKAMKIACKYLSTMADPNAQRNASSRTSTSTDSASGSEGNRAIRDALYGVICVLSRSIELSGDNGIWLFAKGEIPDATSNTLSVFSDTATLLYSCLIGEDESLRPRTVAALDALLGAYSRRLESNSSMVSEAGQPSQVNNPWSEQVVKSVNSMNIDDNRGLDTSTAGLDRNDLANQLTSLLWKASQPTQPKQSRVAAARWSKALLFPLHAAGGSHLLCFLSGDQDVTASNLARQGLGLDIASSKNQKSGEDVCQEASEPTAKFGDLVELLFDDTPTNSKIQWRPTYWEFTPKGKTASIEYLLKSLLGDIYEGEDEAMQVFLSAVCESLKIAANQGRDYIDLLDECAEGLSSCLSTSSFARSLISSYEGMPLRPGDIRDLTLIANSSRTRRLLADAWGSLYLDTLMWENNQWVRGVEEALTSCEGDLRVENPGSSGRKHGAAFLGGTCIKVIRQHPTLKTSGSLVSLASSVFLGMSNEVLNADDTLGNAFSDGLAIACSYRQDDSPPLDDYLAAGATNALSQIAQGIRKFGNGDKIDVSRVLRLTAAAGTCLAATTLTTESENKTIGNARLKCTESLFVLLGSASFRKDEEVALAVGEALAVYADAFSPENVTWSSTNNDWPSKLDEEFGNKLPPHQQVLYFLLRRAKLENNPQKRTSIAPALFAVVAKAAKRINFSGKMSNRCLETELCLHLAEIQQTFIKLLADPKSKHLCRESCCLGLAACRSLAKILPEETAVGDMTDRLMRAFGQTSNHGRSAMQESEHQAVERRRAEGNRELLSMEVETEAEVGGASGIGEASLGAYSEMAGAAVSLGRPDILYALFIMSVSNSAWLGEGRDYGPMALLGQESFLGNEGDGVEMRNALRGHLGKLLPRILRGCHSPNKATREQMQNLWNGLTGGGVRAREAITAHLLVTIDTLIEDTSSKMWRTRLGACGALAQVIVGRSWQDLGGGEAVLMDDDVLTKTRTETTSAGIRLLRLWRVSMRALDDVRGNVREAGEALGRGVRALTLRLVDPNAINDDAESAVNRTWHEKHASAAAATSLRWLLKHGLNQACPEAAGVCISCLVGIVDVANPNILQSLIPDLMRSLLLAMSSLEPAAFNYLQVRAAGQDREGNMSYDSLERLRLQAIQTGPLAEAIAKCVDLLPRMSLTMQKAVVPELNTAIRLSAGVTTRTASADCVSALCNTCPDAFRNRGSGAINPSVSLLRALYYSSERERGQAARDKYAHAFGNLAALCPGPSVRSLALKAADKYNASTGSNDDPAARKAAAMVLRAIAVKASNQFADGGNTDLWCRRVLPVAFLGMRDDDSKISSLFSDVWEEGGSAVNLAGAADGYGNLLEEKLLKDLTKECLRALRDVSWSRRATGSMALKGLAQKEILSPPPRQASGTSSFEMTGRAKRRAEASDLAIGGLVELISTTRLWSGKQHVVEACCAIASKWLSALATSDDLQRVLGIDIQHCRWLPIDLKEQDVANDLFVGDGWFLTQIEDDMEVGENQSKEATNLAEAMQLDTQESDGKINFDESDVPDEQVEAKARVDDVKDEASRVVTFSGVCRLFLAQAFPPKRSTLSVRDEEILPYRASALKSLTHLLHSIDTSSNDADYKKHILQFVREKLGPIFATEEPEISESPLLISRSIDCFAACFWEDFGSGDVEDWAQSPRVLVGKFQMRSRQEQPWTVKTSALKACARLVLKCDTNCLGNHVTISALIESVETSLMDRKFWKVRLAGLELLHSLVKRAGRGPNSSATNLTKHQDKGAQKRQLFLEALLPQKETMTKLTKKTLSDSEAKVTALASNILSSMAWWP